MHLYLSTSPTQHAQWQVFRQMFGTPDRMACLYLYTMSSEGAERSVAERAVCERARMAPCSREPRCARPACCSTAMSRAGQVIHHFKYNPGDRACMVTCCPDVP